MPTIGVSRILIAGDRNWSNLASIFKQIQFEEASTVIIQGGAKGADALAKEAAKMVGLPVIQFDADWSVGKAAGPIRNQRMLDEGQPTKVLIFHPNIFLSKGSQDMMKRALKAGIPVEYFST